MHVCLSVCLSAQKAELLDFPTHSAFILDMRMAKNPEKVSTFLHDLEKRLQPLKQQEVDIFLKYKREDVRIRFDSMS